ncbi:unnamed protein product [Sphagnum tenellum]
MDLCAAEESDREIHVMNLRRLQKDKKRGDASVAAGDFAVGSTKLTVQLRTWEHSTPALGVDVRQVLQDYQVATQTAQLVVFGASACVRVCLLGISCWTSAGRADTGTITQSDEAANSSKEGKSIGAIEQVREFLS